MCDENLINRINNLNPGQIGRAIELLLPRLQRDFNEQISNDTAQAVMSLDMVQISMAMSGILKAQGYNIEAEDIRISVENKSTRTDLAKAMLIELAKLPKTCIVIDSVVRSAEKEMIAPFVILAVGLAGSMGLRSTSVLILALKNESKDAEKAIKHIADALKSAFDASKLGLGDANLWAERASRGRQ